MAKPEDFAISFGPFATTTVDITGQYMRMMNEVMRNIVPPPSDSEQLLQTQAQLKQYIDAFEKLKKQANPLATVMRVKATKTILMYGGKNVEVETPKDLPLQPGSTVKITGDTMQIVDVVDLDSAGEVANVTRIAKPGICEVDRAGTCRAVAYSGELEEGDRVVLDSSGSVVVTNLGKPANASVFSEPTGVTWDDIGGLAEAKRQMREAVEAPTRHADMFARYGKKPMRGVLLYGPPGCGKTLLAKAAATALAEVHGAQGAGAFFYVKGPELLSMYVGNTEQNIRRLFESARLHKKKHGFPAVLFIDEADAILGRRTQFGFGLNQTTVPQFLAEMDGLNDTGALVLLATNLPHSLDPAIVRDGRIDRRIKVGRPDANDSREILAKHLVGKPLREDVTDSIIGAVFDSKRVLMRVRKESSIGDGVAMTLGHCVNGAMLAGIVDRATSVAMHRELAGGESGVGCDDVLHAVNDAHAQMADINLENELADFCSGWEHEVVEIRRANGKRQAANVGN